MKRYILTKLRRQAALATLVWLVVILTAPVAEARRSSLLRPPGRNGSRARRLDRPGRARARPTAKETILWQRAQEVFMSGEYELAGSIYEELLTNYPRTSYRHEALYRQGLCFLKNDLFLKARERFLQLLNLGRASRVPLDEVQLSMADSYFLEEDIDRAFLEYRKIPVQYPNSQYLARVYSQLGECSRKKGRWAEARHYFKKVRQDYPLSFEARQLDRLLLNETLFFEIQAGSFKKKDNALELCNRLLMKGYQAYVSRTTRAGEVFYRVRIGRYDTRAEAEFDESRLKNQGFPTKIYP